MVKPLNNSQKSSLSAALSCLEDAIRSIQDVFDSEQGSHLFYQYTNPLPMDKKEEVARELDLMLDIAEKVKEKFHLEVEEIDVRRRILSEISTTWEYLHDSKARRLRRYGEIPSNLESKLDPYLEGLIESIERVRSIVEGS